jgi:hypothetical protein
MVEGEMPKQAHGRTSALDILHSSATPLDKVRQLVAMGYDELDADQLVSSLQVGPNQMLYYEQLPSPDYNEDWAEES